MGFAGDGEPRRTDGLRVCRTGVGDLAPMWALTSYYNPARYRRRRENYRAFRARCGLPLIAIEMAADGVFELAPGDADILVGVTGGDVMWQKERLLNLALTMLPAACGKIAWVDCDVIFASPDWAEAASAVLDTRPLVQLFGAVHYLPRDCGPNDVGRAAPELTRMSLAYAAAHGDPDPCRSFDASGIHGMGALASGFAWAARRELMESHGFYDACIVGGGDTAMVAAAFRTPGRAVSRLAMTDQHRDHYLDWAGRFGAAVAGEVGAIETGIYHLWHGDLANRGRRQRYDGLAGFGFDPSVDIVAARGGAWRWASDKPGLHQFLADYFVSRREDG